MPLHLGVATDAVYGAGMLFRMASLTGVMGPFFSELRDRSRFLAVALGAAAELLLMLTVGEVKQGGTAWALPGRACAGEQQQDKKEAGSIVQHITLLRKWNLTFH